jgi:hypothetical protein
MPAYDTLLEALGGLKKRGYTTDFNLAFDKLNCPVTGVCLSPSQFEITEHHRFEGMSNPDDNSVIYAIEAKDGSMKGVLVNAYGVYTDSMSTEMLQKLAMNEVTPGNS